MEDDDEVADPVHSLKHDHRVIERALRAIDGVCTRLGWGERVPPEVLAGLVEFISDFADRYHHGKEERYLFPALQRRGIGVGRGPLSVIVNEHEAERELTERMKEAVEGYRELDEASARRFVQAASTYGDHLLKHMEREDCILFRLADEVLDDADKVLLADEFKRAELALGFDARDRLERRAAELEMEWAI